MKVVADNDEELDIAPVFMIGFDEELESGVIMILPLHDAIVEEQPEFAIWAIDAAIDMLMQRRDRLEKRELH